MMNARVLCLRAKPVTLEAGLTEHRHPPSQKHCGARRRRAPSYRHWCEPEGYVESSSMPIRRLLLRHGPTRTLDCSFDSPVSGFDAGRVFRIAHRVSSRKRTGGVGASRGRIRSGVDRVCSTALFHLVVTKKPFLTSV